MKTSYFFNKKDKELFLEVKLHFCNQFTINSEEHNLAMFEGAMLLVDTHYSEWKNFTQQTFFWRTFLKYMHGIHLHYLAKTVMPENHKKYDGITKQEAFTLIKKSIEINYENFNYYINSGLHYNINKAKVTKKKILQKHTI